MIRSSPGTAEHLTLAKIVVLIGSLMGASSAVWIRLLPPTSPVMVGFVRAAGAALFFLPWFIMEWRKKSPDIKAFKYSVGSGIALGIHFATWIGSLTYTTVAQSELLVSTYPLFIILMSLTILRRSVGRKQIIGAFIATAGIVFIQLMAQADVTHVVPAADPWLGNMLAIIGGFFAAIYLLLGQEARRSLSTIMHVEVAYSSAAVVLILFALYTGDTALPTAGKTWFLLAMLVLIPTVGGHTTFNWGVRHLGAPLVSLFGLLEPIEGALLALIILGEPLGTSTIIGGAIVLVGLTVALSHKEAVETELQESL